MSKAFLYTLLDSMSVSGHEIPLQKKVIAEMTPHCDKIITDYTGNVVCVLNPDAPFKVMLAAHMDEIGLMVTAVTEDGFLKVTRIGGIRTSTYLGHKVRLHTAGGVLYGSVAFTTDLAKKSDLHTDDLTVDIGAKDKADALAHVALGDTVTFDTDCRELLNNRLCGRGMDNRTGAFIALEAVRRAAELGCKIGAYGAATAGEETTMNGAYFVASRVQPTLAIAVDVTFTSDYPGVSIATTGDVRVGGGPVLVNNPACHRKIQDLLRKAAEKAGIPVQVEAANGRTGTDGDVIHKTGQGVPFSLASIPLRYMHTPAELGSLTDIDQCVELLARFLCDLDEGLDLTWY